jgi:hypothetical protein
MKNIISASVLVLIVIIGATFVANGQVPPPGSTNSNPVPIDGGVISVLGASIAYGAKKLYDRNKQKNGE